MAGWPENPRLISTKVPRLDGLAKASGKAKYPSDVRPEGMLFGMMLYSPYASAKVKSIDTTDAEKLPGVKAVVKIANDGATLRYQGDDVAAVAAETEEQARDAVRAIKVEYEQLPFAVTEEQSMDPATPKIFTPANFRRGAANTKGNPEEALAKSDATIEGSYAAPVITHVCLESHGLTAMWAGEDKIVAWASTQNVLGVANELAGAFKIPVANVTVHTEVMGGGFGSKFGADIWGQTAAKLSKMAGRPVKMFLDRRQEHLAAGNRPSCAANVKMGANKDGKITALIAETRGTGGAR
ncbi:MAG TPA: molybdopterin cofactor-binding domain-containing protein, partial [Isosphaeraceae bacterium]|nr:molybdopterin cofactor-binding domain-containing protein [Isosphaeraceae bacterium]